MKYKILATFILFLANLGFAQSKKEQIEVLNTRIDSLNQVLQSERTFNSDKIKGLNSTVIKLESEISNLKNSLKSPISILYYTIPQLMKYMERQYVVVWMRINNLN